MASSDDRDGVFDSGKVYTHRAIARILGKEDRRWVIQEMIRNGLPCVRLGQECLISGHDINLWIQRMACGWDTKLSDGEDASS